MSREKICARMIVQELTTDHATFEFFLICTPGFEEISARELRQWFPEVNYELEKGGLKVMAPLATGFAFNRVLKTPTRVLLRLITFGCRDFPKLFKKISSFPWEEWLDDRGLVTFHASSSSSRLKIKTRIEETCWEAKVARLKKRGRPHARFEGPPADAYVRIKDDVCSLSLDTSGEILHKRGARLLTAEAPVRETTAASVLIWMQGLASAEGLHDHGIELVDAMCGSGTFLIEAHGLHLPVKSRRFAFEDFVVAGAHDLPFVRSPIQSFTHLVGYDLSEKAFQLAEKNLRECGAAGGAGFEVHQGDFFAANSLPERQPRWLVANPPYDERLQVAGGLKAFYEKLLIAAERVAQPQLAGFLFPESCQPENLLLPAGWKRIGLRKFSNGGIAVSAVVYRGH